ncbi:o-succinylbenzoate synthase [Halorhodospira abdelmalekii]|uniref:o-succinylbenzoate synthase n=1 Tax=Halorhodospira abdelmalekii TaxID=421629 RepID=UPI0019044D28|nr:o-succinylbenzoate synthase [Halorhodospira abdelmalekii]MBK1733755.1 o-succinylbenzoate synthase [Halorhodospira abdelmalekii]
MAGAEAETAARVQRLTVWRYSVPLQPPAPLSWREGLLLEWQSAAGARVYSEISPLPGFSAESLGECEQAAREWLAAGGEAARCVPQLPQLQPPLARSVAGSAVESAAGPGAGSSGARSPAAEPLPGFAALPAAVRYGLESGWLQLSGDAQLPPIPTITPCRLIDPSRMELTVLTESLAAPVVEAEGRVRCLKVKVGRAPLAEEIEKLEWLLTHLPVSVRLRLDANRAWSLLQAHAFCQALPAERIEMIEEPLHAGADYQAWTAHCAIPFAWDETLREQPHADLSTPGLYGIVLKPMLTGLTATAQWAAAAQYAGRQVLLSAAFESNLTLDFYARLQRYWGLADPPGLDTFGAWPAALLEPLQSQATEAAKPVWTREALQWCGEWL